ncbi:ubiquitin carboxyl-terminal hydrolase 45-like [Babylonia areolata]|uniref:ubiquitin carboxyl-terminal hydrolase 45-like n=1 Tax=Babylonia areolata TaxID=304850 RepID=UPI003FD35142
MRVLDAGSTHTYKMGKNRKHRIRKSKENEAEESSDDGVALCPHIAKAVNFAAMRKTLLKPACTLGDCTGCIAEATRSGAKDLFGSPLEGAAACPVEDSDMEPTIWVCLQCGNQGCDRSSREKHAVKHFETPHSGIHCIVANLTTWTAWCYTCDNDIPVESSKRVQECIDFLRKQAGLPRMEFSHITGQRGAQVTSQSDISPTDPSPPASQSRTDKSQVTGRSAGVACQKVKGLNNLGNTCFFNAVMQNLCQTHSLEALLVSGCKKGRSMSIGGCRESHTDSDSSGADGEEEEDGKLKELPVIDIVPGDPGPLTSSLLSFVQEMNNGSAHSTVTPNTLFSHVCKKAPRFKGFQQQDSHELLRYLLDVVRSEEIKRSQSGILKYFKLPESVNPKKVDEETKTKIREYGRQVKYTFLDSLFGGQLVSTVTCEECKHISQIFEPFLDLSLPVTEEKPQRPNQMAGGRRKDSVVVVAGVGGEGGQEEAVAPPSCPVGVDGFAAADRGDKPSKYQERKNRRQARKEAKRKGHLTGPRGSSGGQGKGEEEEEDKGRGGGGEGGGGTKGEREGGLRAGVGSSSNGLDGEEEHSSPHEDPSDADIEDNVESETSRLQGNYENPRSVSSTSTTTIPPPHGSSSSSSSSNTFPTQLNNHHHLQQLNNWCESETDTFPSNLKETHILPQQNADLSQSGDSQPCSLDSLGGGRGGGIKEEGVEGTEKLVNGVSNLELDHHCNSHLHLDHHDSGVSNHLDARPDTSTMDWQGRRPVQDAPSESSSARRESEGGARDPAPVTCDGASGLEKDMEDKLVIGGGGGVEAGGGVAVVGGGAGGLLAKGGERKAAPALPNHIVGKPLKELRREARYKSKTTLAPRYQPSSKECSVMSCLHQFTAAELLTGSNKVSCKMCTKLRPKNATPHKDKKGSDMVYSNAAKQFLILTPPAVLTLHLKRFEQVGYMSRKVNRHVDFPPVLDLAPYCSSLCGDVRAGQRKVLYALFGVVEHSGRLQTGHYTAYVKVRPSLGPLTSFLRGGPSPQHPPANPRDYIRRYIEQVQIGSSSSSSSGGGGGGGGVGSGGGSATVDEDGSSDHQVATDALVPPGRWFHVSDSRINEVTEATVLRAQAYLLFYERVY